MVDVHILLAPHPFSVSLFLVCLLRSISFFLQFLLHAISSGQRLPPSVPKTLIPWTLRKSNRSRATTPIQTFHFPPPPAPLEGALYHNQLQPPSSTTNNNSSLSSFHYSSSSYSAFAPVHTSTSNPPSPPRPGTAGLSSGSGLSGSPLKLRNKQYERIMQSYGPALQNTNVIDMGEVVYLEVC